MKYIKNKWNQLVCHIKRRDLQFVISASFTLVALIGMVFIGVFLYQSYGRAAKEMMLNDTRQLVNQVEINLNNYLRSMMRISDAMYYNVIKKVDMSKDDISHELNLLYEVNKDSLVSIACFSENGELLGAVPVGNVKNNVDVTQQSWFTSAQNKMENLHFSELHVQNIFENSNGRYYWVVSLSRGVELTTEGKISGGILLVDMNFSGIRQLFTEINSQDMGYVYLINSDGEIIYHPKQNLIFSNMLKENNKVASHYEDGVYEERFQGEDRTVVVKTVGYTGWKIVSVTPADRLFQDFNRTEIMAVMIFTATGWAHYSETANMGGFYELTPEFISTYAPDIQAVAPEDAWEQAQIDGKIYMVPCYKNEYASGGNLLVRGDLMEKYGYEDITSREELEAFLDDVCTGEASVSALGTGGGEFQDLYEWLTLGYSAINGDDNKLFMYHYADPSDLEVRYILDWDEFSDYCHKMQEMYEKGYWSADSLTFRQ